MGCLLIALVMVAALVAAAVIVLPRLTRLVRQATDALKARQRRDDELVRRLEIDLAQLEDLAVEDPIVQSEIQVLRELVATQKRS